MNAKDLSHRFHKRIKELGHNIPLAHCYELVAVTTGDRNWNVAKSKVSSSKVDPMQLTKNQDWDAHKWAQAFIQTLEENKGIEIDEGLMIAWFANAIMACHDDLHNTKIKELEEKKLKLLRLLLLTDPAVSNQQVGELQMLQHEEWLRAFPDERKALEQWLENQRSSSLEAVKKSGEGKLYTKEELRRRSKI